MAFVEAWSIPPAAKRADAAIVGGGGDLVVIDFVSRQFTRETTTTGDFAALVKDLKLGVTEKLEQVDVTLRHALAAGAGSHRIFPLVVIAGAFPMMPPLDAVINDGLAALKIEVINSMPNCRPWMVLDLLGFLTLLGVSTATGVGVPDLLDQWQRSPLARNEFREWALRDGPARQLPGGGLPNDAWPRISRYLGFGTDGVSVDAR